MTENRILAEKIFARMESYGFKPYNIEYGNSYFIMYHGEDSVIHFRVKGVWKHWKFGMWINRDEEKDDKLDIDIFVQYDTQIDKFKPSRSKMCVNIQKYQIDRLDDDFNSLYELKCMLKFMRLHPFMAYEDTYRYYDGSFIWNFVKNESEVYVNAARKAIQYAIWVPYTKLKCSIAKHDKCISKLTLYDFEKENPGWRTDSIFQVKVEFTADSTHEENCAWLDKWFKKDKYGKFGYYDYIIRLSSFFTRVGSSERLFYEREK